MPDAITAKTGVKIVPTIAADEQQLSLMIASGDLPELIFTDYRMMKRLLDPSLCWSWNDLIKKYAADFAIEPIRISLYTRPDGKFYTILNNFSSEKEWNASRYAMPGGSGMAMREDLYKELGSPALASLADLDKVLGMAKARYAARVPLMMNSNWNGLGRNGTFIGSQYGLTSEGFIPVDENNLRGAVQYYLRAPLRLDYYRYVNALYRKGYVIPEEYAQKNEDESFQYAYNDQAFAFMKGSNTADILNADLARLKKGFTYFQVPQILEKTARWYNNATGWSGMFITKKNKNPGKAIGMMKFLYGTEGQQLAMYGIKGKHWEEGPEGRVVFKFNTTDNKFIEGEGIRWWALFISSAVTEGVYNYNPDLVMSITSARDMKKHMVYRPAFGLLTPEPDSRESAIDAKLTEMVRSQEVKIYLADSESAAVAAYNDMIGLAESIGLKDYEAWANTTYKDALKFFK